MKKTLILTSLLAIVATGAASADTDVTFAGDYQLGNGSTANVGTALNGSSYTYTYTYGYDGLNEPLTTTVAQNVNPDLSSFKYIDKDGDPDADLATGGTDLTASDFYGDTVADGVDVISHQTIAADQTISRSNYEYVNGKGETVTLGETAQSFTETVALNSTYATVDSVDVTDSSAAPVLTGSMYVWTDPDTGAVYHLSDDGTKLVDALNMEQTPTAGSAQETAFGEMVAAFADDSAEITTAKTTVDGYATAEATAFANANGIYTTDEATISTLTAYYETYTDATTLLGQAQQAQLARQGDFTEDQALEAAAATLYNTPIETVQAATLQNAKDYADGLASNYDAAGSADTAETNAKAYADSLADNYDAAGSADAAETNAKAYADTGDATTLASAQSYADAGDALTLNAAKAYADAGNALTLNQARAYTDERVEKLNKDLSSGIASAVALSSVSTSGVQKGEVAVSGGYGYYNGQSAMAFGAAMGLSNRWSVNAGAGLSSSDLAFRAGTTYKFKLF